MVRITASLAAAILAMAPATIAAPGTIPNGGQPKDLLSHSHANLHALKSAATESNPEIKLVTLSPSDLTSTSSKPTKGYRPPSSSSSSSIPLHPKRDIIGPDDRHPITSTSSFPSSAIGRWTYLDGTGCTASLVGPRHILTSRLCSEGPWRLLPVFAPGYSNGQNGLAGTSSHSITVMPRADPQACSEMEYGWAVHVLSERLGEQVGWFGVGMPEKGKLGGGSAEEGGIYKHQGYPRDVGNFEVPYREEGVRIEEEGSLSCESGAPLYTKSDVADGQSGSPLWEEDEEGNALIVGILASGDGERASWASGESMVKAVREALAEWP